MQVATWPKLIIKRCSTTSAHVLLSKVYKDMLTNLAKNDKLMNSVDRITNSDMDAVIINTAKNEYTHALLDYCGCIDTFHSEISHLIENDLIQKYGTISITLSKRVRTMKRENSISRQYVESVGLSYENKKTESSEVTDALIKNMVFYNRFKYRLERIFNYNDTGTPMCLYVIKRIA